MKETKKMPQKQAQNESTGLWVPFTIIGIGIIVSIVFAVQTLKGYRKPRPLLIKPSSINTAEELTSALYKALYPLKLQGYGISFTPSDSQFEANLSKSLKEAFPEADKNIIISISQIDLRNKYQNNKVDCLNTALFNMLRKPERKWKKKIYFSVCTEENNKFKIFYTTDKSQLNQS